MRPGPFSDMFVVFKQLHQFFKGFVVVFQNVLGGFQKVLCFSKFPTFTKIILEKALL